MCALSDDGNQRFLDQLFPHFKKILSWLQFDDLRDAFRTIVWLGRQAGLDASGIEDLIQEVLIRLWLWITQLNEPIQDRTHLINLTAMVANQRLIDVWRRSPRETTFREWAAHTLITEGPATGIAVVLEDRWDLTESLERLLTEHERELLWLRFVEDLSYEEIGRRWNRHASTVHRSIRKILARLRRDLLRESSDPTSRTYPEFDASQLRRRSIAEAVRSKLEDS